MSGRSLAGATGQSTFQTDDEQFTFTTQDQDVLVLKTTGIQLPTYTTNGFLKTDNGDGTVIIDDLDLSPITLDPQNGRVGIGSTTPMEAMDVNGNVVISGTSIFDPSMKPSFSSEQGVVMVKNGVLVVDNTNFQLPNGTVGQVETNMAFQNAYSTMVMGLGSDGKGLMVNINEDIDFATTKGIRMWGGTINASTTPSLVITDAGNVGIGLTNPTAKLHVSGNATISGSINCNSITSSGNATINGTMSVSGGATVFGQNVITTPDNPLRIKYLSASITPPAGIAFPSHSLTWTEGGVGGQYSILTATGTYGTTSVRNIFLSQNDPLSTVGQGRLENVALTGSNNTFSVRYNLNANGTSTYFINITVIYIKNF